MGTAEVVLNTLAMGISPMSGIFQYIAKKWLLFRFIIARFYNRIFHPGNATSIETWKKGASIRVEVAPFVSINCLVWGAKQSCDSKLGIILIPGWAGRALDWEVGGLGGTLAEKTGHTTIAVDQRGIGNSDSHPGETEGPLSLETLADDIATITKHF